MGRTTAECDAASPKREDRRRVLYSVGALILVPPLLAIGISGIDASSPFHMANMVAAASREISPAADASIDAFRDRILVWKAISLIIFTF